jgi:ABC-2 type transport system ATP-binding protein
MLTVKNINKNFGEINALSDVSFDIEGNCVVGLLGPNGAGKTTLMRVLVGFLTANSGKIYWDKKIVNTKSLKHKSRVGYLPENNPLYGYMRVIEYMEFIAQLKGLNRATYKLEILKSMKECGLFEVLDQKIDTLSKGFRQRVGLAAALIGDPKILVLDEPTSGLDPNQIIEIRDLIKHLSKKKMVLLSTHILPEAMAVCDKLLIINRGRIVLDEETKKVKNLEKKFVELTI